MTAPLAVKLTLPDGSERMITRQVMDLRFSSKMRGGFASCEAPLSRPLNLPGVPEFSRLTVYDTRNGNTVWDGRVITPGRSVTRAGQVANLAAIGEGVAATKDTSQPYMIVDSSLSSWEQQTTSKQGLSVRYGSIPTGSTADGLTFTARGDVVNGDQAIAWHRGLYLCGQQIGAWSFTRLAGETSGRSLDARIGDTPLAVSTVRGSYSWPLSSTTTLVQFDPDVWPDSSVPKFGFRFTADGTAGDNTWATITAAVVYARLLGRDRQPIPHATYTTAPWIGVHDAFTDVIARFCPTLDIANAVIDETGEFLFSQLAWPDSPISPAQVLDELLDMEVGFTWEVWERGANGLYRTVLRRLPTEVRYETSPADGWSSPSPASEAYSHVIVLWTDAAGRRQATRVTDDSPILTAAGRVRSTTITLGREVGTEDQATARGQAFLADHRVPPGAGRLSVARPIWDRIDGRYVMPWEIRPGELIRINGVHSMPDALNASSPDGVTVARIAEASFSGSSGSAGLDLDVPALTESRAIARLLNARTRG